MSDIEGQIERWEIGRLRRYAKNAKKHPDKQVKALMRMIQRVGFRSPIQVDEAGEIIAGHGRLTAAEQLGMADVPVLVQRGLTDQQKRELRLADNRLAELAETDEALLLEELEALGKDGSELLALGFDDKAMKKLAAAATKQAFPKQGVKEWQDVEGFYAMPAWLEPIWEQATDVLVQFSGGKDSTTAAIWAAHHSSGKHVKLVFSDPGVEFPGMGAHIADVAHHLGIEYAIVKPQREWWAWLAEEGRWPSIIFRPCAHQMVHAPFATFVREHERGKTILLTGSRAEEANLGSTKTERSELSSLGAAAKHYQHFAPCFAIKKETEEQLLESVGVPLWEGYDRGFVRTACWCCPGQCGRQAFALEREYPGLAADMRRWEKRLGALQPDASGGPRYLDDLIRAGQKADAARKLQTQGQLPPERRDECRLDEGEACHVCAQ